MCDMVISFVNRKGGSAKTTSAAYIATCIATDTDKRVLCIDSDNEQSLMKWKESGALEGIDVLAVEEDKLKHTVKKIQKDSSYDVILIDTPPNNVGVIHTVSALSDGVIVTLSPSFQDVLRLASTLSPIETIEELKGVGLTNVLLTSAKTNTNILQEVRTELEANNIAVCDTVIYDRVRYQQDDISYLDEYMTLCKELEII